MALEKYLAIAGLALSIFFVAEIIKKMLKYSSEKTDLVFDPFLGSGQVAVISKMLGRQYLGFEIVKQYYDFANKRLQKNIYRLKKEIDT